MRRWQTAVAAAVAAAAAATVTAQAPGEVLVFEDTFDVFNLSLWKHELTLTGGGNWEFEVYVNNRTNSFVKNGTLTLYPTLLADAIGAANVLNGFTLDMNGGDPASACTSGFEYGCLRTSGGGNILNPIQSTRIRTAETFAFTYGRLEVVAQLPRGDWLWPAIWLLPSNDAYGDWPVSGEIDVMESRGNAPGPPEGGLAASRLCARAAASLAPPAPPPPPPPCRLRGIWVDAALGPVRLRGRVVGNARRVQPAQRRPVAGHAHVRPVLERHHHADVH